MTRLAGPKLVDALLAATLVAIASQAALAQTSGTLRAEENFRVSPNGELLARLAADTRLTVLSTEGGWLQVELVGWVWMRSLQAREQSNFDLVVSEPEGENLRDQPQGRVLGRLERGTLLDELAREPGWIQVSRRGWIWAASVEVSDAPAVSAAVGTARPASAPSRGVEPAPASRPGGFAKAGPDGLPILTAPDGDTLALAAPRSELEVTAREGNWVRIRLEGWAWMPASREREQDADTAVLTPDDLARDPDAHLGRVVSWRLQFVSLERAEAVRTDFREGEPFMLTRFGGANGPFVYVAIPTDRVPELQGLLPLEFLTVTGRVRSGASVLTGTPIVDLLSYQRNRPRR